jgi:hypothetical protein
MSEPEHLGKRSKRMHWDLDQNTLTTANKFPLNIHFSTPVNQFGGYPFNPQNLENRILRRNQWPLCQPISSPENIIIAFRQHSYLEGLAMVVIWGQMRRTVRYIYGSNLQDINYWLCKSNESIQKTESITEAWNNLTVKLNWTSVITSKVLHFICRSLGFEEDPPVPIDNWIIRNRVWTDWQDSLKKSNEDIIRLKNWNQNSLGAYQRYMTAIITWAARRKWTTTQMESTLFAQYH